MREGGRGGGKKKTGKKKGNNNSVWQRQFTVPVYFPTNIRHQRGMYVPSKYYFGNSSETLLISTQVKNWLPCCGSKKKKSNVNKSQFGTGRKADVDGSP